MRRQELKCYVAPQYQSLCDIANNPVDMEWLLGRDMLSKMEEANRAQKISDNIGSLPSLQSIILKRQPLSFFKDSQRELEVIARSLQLLQCECAQSFMQLARTPPQQNDPGAPPRMNNNVTVKIDLPPKYTNLDRSRGRENSGDCVVFNPPNNDEGVWELRTCSQKHKFMCEKLPGPLPCDRFLITQTKNWFGRDCKYQCLCASPNGLFSNCQPESGHCSHGCQSDRFGPSCQYDTPTNKELNEKITFIQEETENLERTTAVIKNDPEIVSTEEEQKTNK
ncbi:hypothetical protein ElyMa_006568000 [Elysia marginata]|uniref:C-type lectin domain-containing protein n=1 Tax=Elysia marginata TaxID=1093978 RepID=A0AAV4IA77_9GAST|nr:hypothetical protein ElyMa_006568000 [Elysia marginata]